MIMASRVGSLLLLLGHVYGQMTTSSSENPSCALTMFSSLRAEWNAKEEPCQKKLPFDLWVIMKAEGSGPQEAAQQVLENCFKSQGIGLVELVTPKNYITSAGVEAAPGHIVSETEHASTYEGATATTFEAFCEDEGISSVSRVVAILDAAFKSKPPQKNSPPRRRLQSTTSEAGQAHQVAELITGLQDLGCSRTTGEDQILCVMSDSFNSYGYAESLQASGDLPLVDVVKENPVDGNPSSDEGSAMLELAYDIASGATYKFNTAWIGEQNFADDIGVLANEEHCDVIVDDISYVGEPAFRDGVVAEAVNAAVEGGSLYFAAAGNDSGDDDGGEASGWRFPSSFECASGTLADSTDACDGTGVPSHVFNPEATDYHRYLLRFTPWTFETKFMLHWDSDIGTDQDIAVIIYIQDIFSSGFDVWTVADNYSEGKAAEFVNFEALYSVDPVFSFPYLDARWVYYMQIVHFGPTADYIDADFLLLSTDGIGGHSDGNMYGHACAAKGITVAAMDWDEGDGAGGAFEDPETSRVENYSSVGPCIVNGETRSKPDTCAADGTTTSSIGFSEFHGTSAAAPVAAAIATIVRAACFPRVVEHADMMEMLTNYEYTIDYTNDADGAPETWGVEAGHGIISARKMLAWVEANCYESCPGASSAEPTTPAPTTPSATTTPAPTTPAPRTPAPTTPAQTTTPSESIGCYRDEIPRIMGTQAASSGSEMTTEACREVCAGFEYFGTQYGRECYCGDASTELDLYCGETNCADVVCDMPCTGDSSEVCGGKWAMSVYETEPTVMDDYVELGCAADPLTGATDGRLMSVGPIREDAMSAEICFGICQENLPGFEYFGTQWSIECFCSMTLPEDLSFDPEHDGCIRTCAGSPDGEICGGSEAITVYSVVDSAEAAG